MQILSMTEKTSLKSLVDQHIQSLNLAEREPVNLYGPIDYILSLKGKRIRPILTMLAYQSVSGDLPQKALNLGSAIELFHNFTLLHDDIMDKAPVRRGKPTVHTIWDNNVAILSGDALFAYSMELVVKEFPNHAAALIQEYTQTCLEVCEGQMEDMDLAENDSATIPQYIQMIRKKTAALLGGCMSMGAIAGNASEDIRIKMKTFGESVGIAFQLQDDLMDAFPPEGFGKQVGGDIIENKKTFLLLKAQEIANPEQKEKIENLLNQKDNPEEKVREMLNIFEVLNIRELTAQLIEEYIQKARELSKELSREIQFEPVAAFLQEIANRKL